MWQTVRVRLTLWFISLLLLLLLVFSGIIILMESRNETLELEEALRIEARWALESVAEAAGDGAGTRRDAALGSALAPDGLSAEGKALLGGAAPERATLVVRVRGRDGETVRLLGDVTAAAELATGRYGASRWCFLTLYTCRRVRTFRLADPRGFVVEASGVAHDHAELIRLLTGVTVAVPPTIAAAVLAALFLAGRALRPMGVITRAAREIGAGDLSRRISLPGPRDEIKQLADTFDEMIARLDRSFQAQRRFVGDASHELRTPLTIMRGHIEVARTDPHGSPGDLQDCLGIVHAELLRLSKLVDDLLTLQRADAGTLWLTPEETDLGSVAEEVVAGLRRLDGSRCVVVEHPLPVTAEVDPTWFRQVLLNLVENALYYTPSTGTITVTVAQTGQHAVVEVSDTGAGIAPEHLPHLFDRFYRVDKSRSRAHGGVGLGLSIVQEVVHAHGGTIRVCSERDQGSRFTVSLPASTAVARAAGPPAAD